MSQIWVLLSVSSGVITFVKPKFSEALILCLHFVTGLISPARLNSPKIAVLSFTGISVRAEYNAVAMAASIELSESLIPPATLT